MLGPDHIVHVVRDLDAAADFYARAGFTVGARNIHPWGTHNRIVQLADVYIEILSVEEPGKIVPQGGDVFSFGGFNQQFLRSREGLSMLLLKSTDARIDKHRFDEAGIGGFDLFEFERSGKAPDGGLALLKFSLAFAAQSSAPETVFAVCQHHNPAAFWNPMMQVHDNGATRVSSVVYVADKPFAHEEVMRSYIGSTKGEWRLADRFGFALPSAAIEVTSNAAFLRDTGESPAGQGLRLAALRFKVASLETTRAKLDLSDMPYKTVGKRIVLSRTYALGATLVFEDE